MMNKNAVIYFFLSFFVLKIAAQSEQMGATQKPSIQVQSQGKVYAVPDAAEIVILLRYSDLALKPTINATEMASANLVKSIQKYLKDSNDVVVELPTTQDLIKWNAKKKMDVAIGYDVTQKLTVSLKNLEHLPSFFKEVFNYKIYEIERLSYFNRDEAPFLKKARLAAIDDAHAQTEELAVANKVKLGKLFLLQTYQVDIDRGNASFYAMRTYNMLLDGQKLLFTNKKILYSCSATMITEIE